MRFNATLVAVALGTAAGLGGASVASAAQAPSAPAPATAPMAPKAPAQNNTTPKTPPSLKECNRQADEKDLTGKARASYVKDCQAGKTSADQ